MPNPTFPQMMQRLAPGSPFIDLFTLDATAIGGPLERWTEGPIGNAPVIFGGNQYNPVPITATGFEYSGQGPLPRPTLRVSNVENIAMALLINNGDLLGATVTRIQTFACFLDGAEFADAGAYSEPDVYRVNRKSHADKNFVELELAASTDQQGKKLPARQVLQNTCGRTYRVWTGQAFIQQVCPYAGPNYFDTLDNPTTNPALDQCSRTLAGCVARYGATTVLPTWAFPGVGIDSSGG